MSNLVLSKSDNFNGINADFYNDNNNIYMSADQLGKCLGYTDPIIAINKLASRHDYLKTEEFSVITKLVSTDGKSYDTRLFNEDGIYEITFLSKTATAQIFRAWARKVIKEIRKTGCYNTTPSSTSDIALYHISEAVKALAERQTDTQQDIIHIQDNIRFLQDYTNDTIPALGYTIEDIKSQIQQIVTNLKSPDTDTSFIHKRISTQICDFNEFKTAMLRLIFGNDLERKAQTVALYSDTKYKEWVNEQIYHLCKQYHEITGRMRAITYKWLVTNDRNFEQLNIGSDCTLEKILNSKYIDARYSYALTLLGERKRHTIEILNKYKF
jgi:prophage antirepressor-like protein